MGFVGWLGRWREGLAAIAPQLPHSPSSTPSQSAIAAMPTCIVRPQQTEGPYFVDEKLNRSDIRSDPTDGLLKSGVPLKLTFQVSQIGANSCVPLKGAVVDIWHCDAQGIYSDVRDRTFNTTGKKFLRGYQITNALGLAEFTTIYPGWYPGRAVHIHFKIRTSTPSQGIHEFTSQLYFEDTLTDQIHAQSPYAAIGRRNVRNNQDGIFQQGGKNLMLKFVKNAKFYAARFDIGLQI
jgi:protocatechuate 3,4-dioxygenase beta subunit